jgi:hypothetical protein
MLNLNNISWILPFTQRVKAKIRKIQPFGKVYRNASASLPSLPLSRINLQLAPPRRGEGHSGSLSPHICIALKLFTDCQSESDSDKQYKMEQAARFLKESGMNVNQTAILCDFNETSYFIKVFKRFYGTTPSEYRSKMFQ